MQRLRRKCRSLGRGEEEGAAGGGKVRGKRRW